MDLERDLPTTAEDVAALRRASGRSKGNFDYLEFLRAFGETPPERLRTRPGPRGAEPFELPCSTRSP